jgi:hypothetical protein
LGSRKYKFSEDNYRRSSDDYNEQWRTLDSYLYRLCRENPTHSCKLSVNAKVYIIGRTFQTQIERQIQADGTQASSIAKVTDLFSEHHQELDWLFLSLAETSEPLTAPNLQRILEVHGQVVRLLSGVTMMGKSPRSFVSKYMHFHNSVVPMYDDITQGVLPSLVPKRSIKNELASIPNSADPDYACHVLRFLSQYELIVSKNLPVTVRSLDYYLLWEYGNRHVPG